MTRAERRREAREAARSRPSAARLRELNEQRKLPYDHSSRATKEPIFSSRQRGRQAIDFFAGSGVLEELDPAMEGHPGSRSSASTLMLLVGMYLAAEVARSGRVTDVAAALAGVDAEIAIELGHCDRDGWKMPSYKTIYKRLRRMEKLLTQGFENPDGKMRWSKWFKVALLKASIPEQIAEMIVAIALDATDVPGWANGQGKEGDPNDEPDSADPDARFGHRSAAGKRTAGYFFGFKCHLAVACKEAVWKGNPRKITFANHVEPFIVAFDLVPANDNEGHAGRDVALEAKHAAPRTSRVHADRGYTMNPDFLRPLQQMGLDTCQDLPSPAVKRPKLVEAGRNGEKLYEHAGNFFPTHMPARFRVPPKHLKGARLAEWYAKRQLYAWKVEQKLGRGALKLRCPQCAGKITSDAKTRNPAKPKPGKGPGKQKEPVHVQVDVKPGQYCCKGRRVTVTVDQRQRAQTVPFGTPAWKKTYAVRNQVENANSILKDKGGLAPDWCRSLNLMRRKIATLMLIVAHNLRQWRKISDTHPLPEPPPDDIDPDTDPEIGPGAEPAPGRAPPLAD